MRRIAIIVAIVCTAASAAADEWERFYEASAGPAFAGFERTTTYTDTDGGEPPQETPITASGFGAQIGGAGGLGLGAWRAGGFARFQIYGMKLDGDPTRVQATVLGPMIAVGGRHGPYARLDVGTGVASSGNASGVYRLNATLPRVLSAGTELGYEMALSTGWTIRPTLAATATWTRSHEDADHGYYDDAGRLLSISVMVSIVQGP